MASCLADVISYWGATSALTSQVPSSRVYEGMQPPSPTFPYVVIIPISQVPGITTGKSYYEESTFQVSIYHTTLASAESIAGTVCDTLDAAVIATGGMALQRLNYLAVADPDSPKTVFHVAIDYLYRANRARP